VEIKQKLNSKINQKLMGAPDGARFFGWESPIGEKSYKIYTESNIISALRAER
jgi:hypothetical protein